jgi:hypothetical protein
MDLGAHNGDSQWHPHRLEPLEYLVAACMQMGMQVMRFIYM